MGLGGVHHAHSVHEMTDISTRAAVMRAHGAANADGHLPAVW
ncbi:Uncharacterised protein [Nocardia cyriacigeorgica]|uniref:Uncharacterized protein n=1 Tax=Nocardia cyriacigeorgica TaxID=135487 RepID=A0A4U8VSL4_9NOCA|nr:Uncharacterised protein [Nocardia cyriacigeorgica]